MDTNYTSRRFLAIEAGSGSGTSPLPGLVDRLVENQVTLTEGRGWALGTEQDDLPFLRDKSGVRQTQK
jgi:hypothetical protein